MSESAKEKKPRTALQAAANQKASAASKDAMAWMESHKAQGVEKSVLNSGVIQRMQKEGKGEEEILEAVLARQRERKEKKAAKPKANAAPAANNGATKKNNNARSTTTNGTAKNKKPRSAKQAAANNALRALMANFKTHKLKATNPAREYYKAQVLAGKSKNAIFTEMKNMPQFRENAPPVPRSKSKASAPAAVVVPANAGVAKGSYICEKCKLVANNTTRRNNGPKNNMSGNYFPVNASGPSNVGPVNL